jgi:carbon-monoxide dehydrogenase large subunit
MARMILKDDGGVTISVGISASGQGHETVFAQVAGDELGLPLDRISVLHGSTSLLEHGYGTYHSRGAVMGGSAVLLASRRLRERMLSIAARRLNLGVEEIELRHGAVVLKGTDRELMSLHTLAAAAREIGSGVLSADAAIDVSERFEQKVKPYAYGTHIARVAVDVETGKVDVIQYLVVEDIGRSLNPLITHGQAIGGAVQGISTVFLDEIVYGPDGQLLSGNFADYLVATSTDFPNVEAISLDHAPTTLNPLGIKGAGEGGTVATGAALANAIAQALAPLGVKITSLPLNPHRVQAMLREVGCR